MPNQIERNTYIFNKKKVAEGGEASYTPLIAVYGPKGKMPQQFLDVEDNKSVYDEYSKITIPVDLESGLDEEIITAITLGATMSLDEMANNITASSTNSNVSYLVANQSRLFDDVMNADSRANDNFLPLMLKARKKALKAIDDFKKGNKTEAMGYIKTFVDYCVTQSVDMRASDPDNSTSVLKPNKTVFWLGRSILNKELYKGLKNDKEYKKMPIKMESYNKQLDALKESATVKTDIIENFDASFSKRTVEEKEDIVANMLFNSYIANMAYVQDDALEKHIIEVFSYEFEKLGINVNDISYKDGAALPISANPIMKKTVQSQKEFYNNNILGDFDDILATEDGVNKLRSLYLDSIKKSQICKNIVASKTKDELVDNIMASDKVVGKGITSIENVVLPKGKRSASKSILNGFEGQIKGEAKEVISQILDHQDYHKSESDKYSFDNYDLANINKLAKTVDKVYKLLSDNKPAKAVNKAFNSILSVVNDINKLVHNYLDHNKAPDWDFTEAYKQLSMHLDDSVDNYFKSQDLNSDDASVEAVKTSYRILKESAVRIPEVSIKYRNQVQEELFGESYSVLDATSVSEKANTPYASPKYPTSKTYTSPYSVSRTAPISVAMFLLASQGYSFDDIMDNDRIKDVKTKAYEEVMSKMLDSENEESQKWIAKTLHEGRIAINGMVKDEIYKINFTDPNVIKDERYCRLVHLSHAYFDAFQEGGHCSKYLDSYAAEVNYDLKGYDSYMDEWAKNRLPTINLFAAYEKYRNGGVFAYISSVAAAGSVSYMLSNLAVIKKVQREIEEFKVNKKDIPVINWYTPKELDSQVNYIGNGATKITERIKSHVKDSATAKQVVNSIVEGKIGQELEIASNDVNSVKYNNLDTLVNEISKISIMSSIKKVETHNNVFKDKLYYHDIYDILIGFNGAAAYFREDLFKKIELVSKEAVSELSYIIPRTDKTNYYITNPKDLEKMSAAIMKFRKAIVEASDIMNYPKDSHRQRVIDYILNDIDMLINGDIELLRKYGLISEYHNLSTQVYANYPTPQFVTERNENGKAISSEINPDRFEAYMNAHKFPDIAKTRMDFTKDVQIPYLRAKERNEVSYKQEAEYKFALYKTLVKEKECMDEILAIKLEGETADLYIMADRPDALKMEWQGKRFGIPKSRGLDISIKALENGWAAEDLPLVQAVVAMMDHLKKTKNDIDKDTYTLLESNYNSFINSYIMTKEDRANLIESVRPIYQMHLKLDLLAKEQKKGKIDFDAATDEQIEAIYQSLLSKHKEDDKNRQAYIDGAKLNPEIINVSPSNIIRDELIVYFEGRLELLNTVHRGGFKHSDNAEIIDLRNKIKSTLVELKDRSKSIYDCCGEDHKSGIVGDLTEIRRLASVYVEAKRKDEVAKIEKQNLSKDEAQKKIDAFRPSSRMGKTRYEAALSLFDDLDYKIKSLKSKLSSHFETLETEKQAFSEGISVKHAVELDCANQYYYHPARFDTIMNYYGTKPSFIPEHTEIQNQMYNLAMFKEKVKPVDISNVVSDDFALVAYFAALDFDTIDKEQFKADMLRASNCDFDILDVKETYYQLRTMFTTDMAIDVPRANMVDYFFSSTVIPAKEKARRAFANYQNSDKTALVDIIVKGIDECIKECILVTDIARGTGKDFFVNASMLEKIQNFLKKDKDLYDAVNSKLTAKQRDLANDYIRIKSIFDEAFVAEKVLKDADNLNRILTKEEKQNAVDKILRADFISGMHKHALNKMLLKDSKYQKFLNEEYPLMVANHPGQESNNRMDDMNRKTYKPVDKLTVELRTDEGLAAFDKEVVAIRKSNVDLSKSPKELLNDLDKIYDGLTKPNEKFEYEKNSLGERVNNFLNKDSLVDYNKDYLLRVDETVKSADDPFYDFIKIFGSDGKLPEIYDELKDRDRNDSFDVSKYNDIKLEIADGLDEETIAAIVIGASMADPRLTFPMTASSTRIDATGSNQNRIIDDFINGDQRYQNFIPVLIDGRKHAKQAIDAYKNGDVSLVNKYVQSFVDFCVMQSGYVYAGVSNALTANHLPSRKRAFWLGREMLSKKNIGVINEYPDNQLISGKRFKSLTEQLDAAAIAFKDKKMLADNLDGLSKDQKEFLVEDILFNEMLSYMSYVQTEKYGVGSRIEVSNKIVSDILDSYGIDMEEEIDDTKISETNYINNFIDSKVEPTFLKYHLSDFDAILSTEAGRRELKKLYVDKLKSLDIYNELVNSKDRIELVKNFDKATKALKNGVHSFTDIKLPKAALEINSSNKRFINMFIATNDNNVIGMVLDDPKFSAAENANYAFESFTPDGLNKNAKIITDLLVSVMDNAPVDDSKFDKFVGNLQELKAMADRFAKDKERLSRNQFNAYNTLIKKVNDSALKYINSVDLANSDDPEAKARIKLIKDTRRHLKANERGLDKAFNKLIADVDKEIFGDKFDVYDSLALNAEESNPFLGKEFMNPNSRTSPKYSSNRTAGISVAIFALINTGQYSFEDIMDPGKLVKEKKAMFKKVLSHMRGDTDEDNKWIAEQIYKGIKPTEEIIDQYGAGFDYSNPDLIKDKHFCMVLRLQHSVFDAWQEASHCSKQIVELAKEDQPEIKDYNDFSQWWSNRMSPLSHITSLYPKLRTRAADCVLDKNGLNTDAALLMYTTGVLNYSMSKLDEAKKHNQNKPFHEWLDVSTVQTIHNHIGDICAKQMGVSLGFMDKDRELAKKMLNPTLSGYITREIKFGIDPKTKQGTVANIPTREDIERGIADAEAIKKSEDALDRLRSDYAYSKYPEDFVKDSAYAIYGQMFKHLMSVPGDKKTGVKLSFDDYIQRVINDPKKEFENSLKNREGKFYSPVVIYRKAVSDDLYKELLQNTAERRATVEHNIKQSAQKGNAKSAQKNGPNKKNLNK
ncbi:MAG: hypothetical protein K5656_01600 [Lachnospiraceae bacterium]|nr:hypothetical protein [Lachnospiraceae bacterium]